MLTIGSHFLYGLGLFLRQMKVRMAKLRQISGAPQNPGHQGPDRHNGSNFNNIKSNLNISTLFINGLIPASYFAYLVTVYWEWDNYTIPPVILGWVGPYFIMMLVLPLKTCLTNSNIWEHVKSTYLSPWSKLSPDLPQPVIVRFKLGGYAKLEAGKQIGDTYFPNLIPLLPESLDLQKINDKKCHKNVECIFVITYLIVIMTMSLLRYGPILKFSW